MTTLLGRLWRHEWRTLTADRTLPVVVGVFAVAIAYGTFNGARWAAFQQRTIAEAHQEEADRIRRHEQEIVRINREAASVSAFADPRNPEAVGRGLGARHAVLPSSPLTALAIGQSDLLPFSLRITTDAGQNVLAAAELENPLRLLVGRFDLAFVLVYLYPLLVLALTFNVLSAEREQGTLVLALAQPVSLRTLLVGKLTLRFALFVGTIVLLALVALVVARVDLTAPRALGHLALWIAAVAAYGVFWFALALAVVAAGRPSTTNATVLAGLWLLFVVLLPGLFNLLATTVYPVPSRVEMIQAVRGASDEASSHGSTLLAQYYEDHPELATGDAEQAMNDFNLVRVAVDAEIERRVAPVLAAYAEQLAGQQRLVSRLRVLSPAVLMQDALNDIAGTGVPRHQAFLRQVEAFHRQWRGYFVPLIFRKARLTDYGDIPRFAFQEEAFRTVLTRVATGLAALVLPAVLIASLGIQRLRRYPIVG